MQPRILFFLILIASSFQALQAQRMRANPNCPYPQHEISFGYGGLSTDQFSVLTGTVLANPLMEKVLNVDNTSAKFKAIGPIHFTYKYFFKMKASVGFGVVFSNNKITTQTGQLPAVTDVYNTFAFIPRFDFYYLRNPKVAIYGMLGAGPEFRMLNAEDQTKSDNGVGLGFQVTPLAFRFGKEVGFVLEFGFGSYGVGNAAFSYRHYNMPWRM